MDTNADLASRTKIRQGRQGGQGRQGRSQKAKVKNQNLPALRPYQLPTTNYQLPNSHVCIRCC
ncbi:hypothetical protein [Chroococcidiopsis sp. CCALA 051]|uniref:hypothetical protein n=1 Tax=Chroococcidiopsis sp. CCALA 051 TaxID=869949 RepID=UPI0011B1D441|nr:hypothetical protein [Chroococcidiopsis sp. CCALA 051]